MEPVFIIIAGLTLVSAVGAMFWRNPVHCALSLAITLAGLAAFYLRLHAEFVGFAQILVYVGAVAILIVFAILLTRSSEAVPGTPYLSSSWWVGLVVAAGTFLCLAGAISSSSIAPRPTASGTPPVVTVKQIGMLLLDRYVLPLEVMGLLLTAALVGAVLIAMKEKSSAGRNT